METCTWTYLVTTSPCMDCLVAIVALNTHFFPHDLRHRVTRQLACSGVLCGKEQEPTLKLQSQNFQEMLDALRAEPGREKLLPRPPRSTGASDRRSQTFRDFVSLRPPLPRQGASMKPIKPI